MSYNIYDTSINSPNLKVSFRIGVWFERMHLVLNVSVTNKSTWLILKAYQTTGIFEAICCWIGQLANHRYIVVQIDYVKSVKNIRQWSRYHRNNLYEYAFHSMLSENRFRNILFTFKSQLGIHLSDISIILDKTELRDYWDTLKNHIS